MDSGNSKYLTNETIHQSNYYSRYSGVKEYTNTFDKIPGTDEYKRTLALKTHLKHNTDNVINYKVKKGDTWDKLALEFYNNPTYYWIILDWNRYKDPFREPEVGTILEIPTLAGSLEFDAYA